MRLAPFELVGVDDVSIVFIDNHQAILVHHQFLRHAAEMLKTAFQSTDEVDGCKRPFLPDDVLVPGMGQNEYGEVQRYPILIPSYCMICAEIHLQLLSGRLLRNAAVVPGVTWFG
jgi:hypothetical protein